MSVLGRSGIDEEASSRCWEETDLLHSPLIVLDHPPRVLKFLISTLLLRRYRAAFSLQKSTVLLADRKRPVRVVKPSPLCEHFLSTEFIVHFYSYTRYNPLRTERMDRDLSEAIRKTVNVKRTGAAPCPMRIPSPTNTISLFSTSVLAYLSTSFARKSEMENGRYCMHQSEAEYANCCATTAMQEYSAPRTAQPQALPPYFSTDNRVQL